MHTLYGMHVYVDALIAGWHRLCLTPESIMCLGYNIYPSSQKLHVVV